MSLTSEEIAALQARAARVDELEGRIAAIDDNKSAILAEKKKLQDQLDEIASQQKEREKQELEAQGRTAELLEQERKEKEALLQEKQRLEREKEELEVQRIKDRLESDFVSVLSGEVFAPKQLWMLVAPAAQNVNGKTVVNYKGSQLAPSELAERLRSDPEYSHHFKPKQASGGMGSRPTPGSSATTSVNPYLPGGSVTQRITLEIENPDLAAKLKAEAGSARANG